MSKWRLRGRKLGGVEGSRGPYTGGGEGKRLYKEGTHVNTHICTPVHASLVCVCLLSG